MQGLPYAPLRAILRVVWVGGECEGRAECGGLADRSCSCRGVGDVAWRVRYGVRSCAAHGRIVYGMAVRPYSPST